jgi:uncharacterized protein YgbK (DUF1537 family)
MALPTGLILGYYGDDFTGSTDVMEALSYAGVETVLFIEPPTAEDLARFPAVQAVGIAGLTRSCAADAMEAELAPALSRFAEIGCRLAHYKTCSTFDSAPEVGSIGRAIDIGQRIFAAPFVPLVVGAPALQRFCLFGNLFARSGLDSEVFRLDRHPTMRRHPITPMREADLRLHLAAQTQRKVGLFDVLELGLSRVDMDTCFADKLAQNIEIMLFDTLEQKDLEQVGRIVWEYATERPLFCAGSSGLEYALTAHWRAAGLLSSASVPAGGAEVEQVLVVSGSCSPVTQRQIEHAVGSSFADIPADTEKLVCGGALADEEIERLVRASSDALERGQSPLVHTAKGPDDARIEATARVFAERGYNELDIKLRSGAVFGRVLGQILAVLAERTGIRRACVAGGDTSAYAARELGVEALKVVGPMAPGSPLCRVYSSRAVIDGMEITFKGGQVGREDFFSRVLRGRP